MPVYEFFCPKCDSKFELRRCVSDAAEAASCPKCKGEGRRVFSPFTAFNKFADVSEGSAPIAGAGGGCSSCSTGSGGGGCSGCH